MEPEKYLDKIVEAWWREFNSDLVIDDKAPVYFDIYRKDSYTGNPCRNEYAVISWDIEGGWCIIMVTNSPKNVYGFLRCIEVIPVGDLKYILDLDDLIRKIEVNLTNRQHQYETKSKEIQKVLNLKRDKGDI